MSIVTRAPASDLSTGAAGTTQSAGSHHRRRRIPSWVFTLGSLVIVVGAWEILGRRIDPLFASYPSAIAQAAVRITTNGELPIALWDSLRPMLTGYVLAAFIAIPIGLLLGRYRVARACLGIYVSAGYALPMVALIPLFILWFGLGYTVKVAVVLVMSMFPIIINTAAGARSVPRSLIDVGQSFMASEFQLMRKVVVPSTVPYIMTGLRLGVGRAIIGIVVAEFFTSLGGLGGMIVDAGARFQTDKLFVPVLVLMLLGVALTSGIEWLEHRVAPWSRTDEQD